MRTIRGRSNLPSNGQSSHDPTAVRVSCPQLRLIADSRKQPALAPEANPHHYNPLKSLLVRGRQVRETTVFKHSIILKCVFSTSSFADFLQSVERVRMDPALMFRAVPRYVRVASLVTDDLYCFHVEFNLSDCPRSLENRYRKLRPGIRYGTQSGMLNYISYAITAFTAVHYSRKARGALSSKT